MSPICALLRYKLYRSCTDVTIMAQDSRLTWASLPCRDVDTTEHPLDRSWRQNSLPMPRDPPTTKQFLFASEVAFIDTAIDVGIAYFMIFTDEHLGGQDAADSPTSAP